MINKTRQQIARDLHVLSVLVDQDPLYPIEDTNLLLARLKANIEVIQNHNDSNTSGISVGRWVQIIEKTNSPFYGKIERFHDDQHVTIKGLYATGPDGKLVQRAIRIDLCLPVSRAVARTLEFANDMNTIKLQPHLLGNIK